LDVSRWENPQSDYHFLVDGRRHSSVLDVLSFRAADCDTDHYLVVAKVRERLPVNKQRSHRFHMERFNFKKLKEVQGKEQYRVEVSNRFANREIWMQMWKLIVSLQQTVRTRTSETCIGE
jgi:hypothetical protein